MKYKMTVLLAACLLAASVLAGEEVHRKMAIAVVEADGDNETRIEIDSDNLGFDLEDMQVGENHSIVDKSGRSILVTRTNDGYTFDVDGKSIDVPLFDAHDSADVWINKDEHHSDVDVHVVHDGMTAKAVALDGVMIISSSEIDAATQQVIRSALEAAGHSDVRFSDGVHNRSHQVRVVKKVVDVTQ